MNNPRVQIRIGASADPSVGQVMDRLLGRLAGLNGFAEGLRTQFAALASGYAFKRLIELGVRVNATWQQAQRSLAGVFLQNMPELKGPEEAFRRAAEAVDLLREKSQKTSAEFGDLLQTYSVNSGLLFSSGITSVRRQIELIGLLGEAAKQKGLTGMQLVTELRALFTGNFGPDALIANQMFSTEQARAKWRKALQSGGAEQMLMNSPMLKSVATISKITVKDWDVVAGNFKEAIDTLAGSAMQSLFHTLSGALSGLTRVLGEPWVKQFATSGVQAIVNAAYSLGGLLGLAGAGKLIGLAKGALGLHGVAGLRALRELASEAGGGIGGWAKAVTGSAFGSSAMRLMGVVGKLSAAFLALNGAVTLYRANVARNIRENDAQESLPSLRASLEGRIAAAARLGQLSPEQAAAYTSQITSAYRSRRGDHMGMATFGAGIVGASSVFDPVAALTQLQALDRATEHLREKTARVERVNEDAAEMFQRNIAGAYDDLLKLLPAQDRFNRLQSDQLQIERALNAERDPLKHQQLVEKWRSVTAQLRPTSVNADQFAISPPQRSESSRRGLFGSAADWRVWASQLNVSKAMLDELKEIRTILGEGIAVEI